MNVHKQATAAHSVSVSGSTRVAFYQHTAAALRPFGVKITRLARGLPTGSTIEYASGRILTAAILGRQTLD